MPRKKHRSFDCYPDDFLAGTEGMDPLLFKAHTRLFMKMYSVGGPLLYDFDALRWTIEAKRPSDAKRLIEKLIATKHYYVDAKGYLHHERVDRALGLPVNSGSSQAQVDGQMAGNLAASWPPKSPKRSTETTDQRSGSSRERATPPASTSPIVSDSAKAESSSTRPEPRRRDEAEDEQVAVEAAETASVTGGSRSDMRHECRTAIEAYLEMAERVKLPTVIVPLSAERYKRLKTILAKYGIGNWLRAMQLVEESDFCRGLGGRGGWKASFDFLLQQNSFSRLLEGRYANGIPSAVSAEGTSNGHSYPYEDETTRSQAYMKRRLAEMAKESGGGPH